MEAAKTAGPLKNVLAGQGIGVLLLLILPVGSLWGSDFYLPRLGPAPLRFAVAAANSKSFAWPIPLNPIHSSTNSAVASGLGAPVAATNSAAASVTTGFQTQTNIILGAPGADTAAASSIQTAPSIPIGADGNPLSASNLLLVTPQMLADFFKANLDGGYRASTNGLNGADILFNPPIPKNTPSSEATYRTQ